MYEHVLIFAMQYCAFFLLTVNNIGELPGESHMGPPVSTLMFKEKMRIIRSACASMLQRFLHLELSVTM